MMLEPSSVSSSAPSPLSYPSTASAAALLFVAYDLRSGAEPYPYPSLATNIVELPPTALIPHLQRAVFAANLNKLQGRDYTDLDVYPPASVEWPDRSIAAAAEDDVMPLLPGSDISDRTLRRFTVVARRGARGAAVKLQTTTVPERVRAVVGRVCRRKKRGQEEDFVARTVGSGVWFGVGGVVLTAHHVVRGLTHPLFYLYDRRAGVWVRRVMRVVAEHRSWDIAVLQQEGPAREEGEGRDGDSAYAPQLLDTLSPQPEADAWTVGFPQIIDDTLTPTARSSDSHLAPSTSSSTVAALISSSSASTAPSSLSTSSGSPSTASSSSSSSGDETEELSCTTRPASSSSTFAATSLPTSSLSDWQPQSPVVTRGVICKAGYGQLIHIADYIAAPNNSGGAVVSESEAGDWYLIGIHVAVVQHDIDESKDEQQRITQASGTCPFAEFIAIHRIAPWYETTLPANCQVFNSATNRLGPTAILGKRKGSHSATEQSAAVAADAGEGRGADEDELVYEVSEGWEGYYDNRVPPVPLPARPRTQSDPTQRRDFGAARLAGESTGGRDTRSL